MTAPDRERGVPNRELGTIERIDAKGRMEIRWDSGRTEGEIWLTLRHQWADGTTHLRFDPLELLERLAVLTPRPRVNLIFYYGVLAPRAA